MLSQELRTVVAYLDDHARVEQALTATEVVGLRGVLQAAADQAEALERQVVPAAARTGGADGLPPGVASLWHERLRRLTAAGLGNGGVA